MRPGEIYRRIPQSARIALPDRLESCNFLRSQRFDEVFTPDYLAHIDPDKPMALMREQYFRARSASILNRMLHLWKQALAGNILRKAHRMTNAAGIDVRYPLLEERLVAFAALLPPCTRFSATTDPNLRRQAKGRFSIENNALTAPVIRIGGRPGTTPEGLEKARHPGRPERPRCRGVRSRRRKPLLYVPPSRRRRCGTTPMQSP